MKGIISSGSIFHSNYLAKAMQENKMLKKYIVGNHKKVDLGVKKEFIKNISIQNYIGYILRNFPIIGKKVCYNYVSDNIFDVLAKKHLDDVNFYIGFNNYSLKQMKKMKKENNTILFLDQRIVHVNTELELANKYFKKIPSNLGKKIVLKKKEEYEIADYIFVGSNYVKDTFINNGISKEKIIVVPYGYDPNVFYNEKKRKAIKNKLNIVFVGQIGIRKGVNYLLEAIKILKEKKYDINLTLAGNIDSNFKAEFEKYKKYITYKSYLSNDQLRELYNESDIMVFPSLWEGSARVLYDSAACGVVNIASVSSGSIIEDGVDGLIIKEISVQGIIEQINKVYNNTSELERLRKNSLMKIKKFTWNEYGNNVIKEIKCRVR